jgi:hypothetical protein
MAAKSMFRFYFGSKKCYKKWIHDSDSDVNYTQKNKDSISCILQWYLYMLLEADMHCLVLAQSTR